MSGYRYRIVLASIINGFIFIICLCVFFIPDITTWRQYEADEKNWQQQYATLKQRNESNATLLQNHPLSPHQATSFLLRFAAQHQLKLNSLQQKNERLFIQVQGEFVAIAAFLLDLYQLHASIQDYHFTWDKTQQKITSTLSVILFDHATLQTTTNATQLYNPFCKAMNLYQSANQTELSIHELKLAGYIQYQHKAHALLSSPSGRVFDVTHGDHIGKEGATVQTISPHVVELQLPNKKIISIK